MSDNAPATITDRPADDQLLEMLRCPMTLSPLRREGEELIAEVGGLRYPIKNGIPQMLVEDAKLPEGVSSLDELKKQLREQGQTVRE